MLIDRTFIRIAEGLLHYRYIEPTDSSAIPLLMMHPSPASSIAMEPLMQAIGNDRKLIAPDTLGCGDSAAPTPEAPELPYYADSMLRFLDAMDIEQCHVYGSHTGAHIGIELAILAPQRIKTLTLDGVALLGEEERGDFLENYAPPQSIDGHGGHYARVWQYVRDQMVFFPHYKRDDAHRREGGDFSAERLHSINMDLLKNLDHYHKTYNAVFQQDVLERLAQVNIDTMLLTSLDDPLHFAVQPMMECKPDIKLREFPQDSAQNKANALNDLLKKP